MKIGNFRVGNVSKIKTMKNKRIISRTFTALLILSTIFLSSCEEYNAFFNCWTCDNCPTGNTYHTCEHDEMQLYEQSGCDCHW